LKIKPPAYIGEEVVMFLKVAVDNLEKTDSSTLLGKGIQTQKLKLRMEAQQFHRQF
jgi:hypothetical protein